MAPRTAHSCAQRTATEALAREDLDGAEAEAAELHLERCEPCRTLFRQQTAHRFPRIRNYTIVAELGRGGFGLVYKALHHSKERWEALKVLFGQTSRRTAYFENEVRLVAKLRHPNIATLYDANLHTAPLFYAMEFVEGRHLDDYFRSHEVSLEERIELVKTVAAAVGYAHQQGVIHRDLKPQNILIDAQGQPRIVDFGIAKRLVTESPGDEQREPARGSPEGALGTYGYISPEQLAGQDVDSRADVYSLGALLFHVITGQPARFAPQADRLRDVLHERKVSRADDLAAIIACCVRPSPDERYQTCEDLVADLDNYLAGRPIRARADSTPGYRVARVAALVLRNHPIPVQAVAVLLVAVLVVRIYWVQGAQWLSVGQGNTEVALVAFTPDTVEALRAGRIGADLPGIDVDNPKSFRVLHGRLMERLAEAGPRLVVWDYSFPDCQPAFDGPFLDGLRSLEAPVVVGTNNLDLNAEPVMCASVRAAVHGWGTMFGTRPLDGAVYMPLALQRGLNPPVPSLALAGFAAARRPDSDLEIRVEADALQLHYRKRHVTGELRRPYPPDRIPIVKAEVAGPNPPGIDPADKCLFGRLRLEQVPQWAAAAIPFEEVLTAGHDQLERWFAGRAVLVGQMIPPQDYRELGPGKFFFGCQVQAAALQDLLRGTQYRRFAGAGLVTLVAACCILAALLAQLVPVRDRWPLPLLNLTAAVVFCAALVVALVTAPFAQQEWMVRTSAAACGFFAAGAAALLIKLLHRRQLHLAPGPVWPAEGTTASTTVLAGSSRDRRD